MRNESLFFLLIEKSNLGKKVFTKLYDLFVFIRNLIRYYDPLWTDKNSFE